MPIYDAERSADSYFDIRTHLAPSSASRSSRSGFTKEQCAVHGLEGAPAAEKHPTRAEGFRMAEHGKSLHHFIPRSYLRVFSNDGRLASMLREPYEVRDTHVNTVAAEHKFYKVFTLDGSPSDDVEDELATFDGLIPGIVSAAVASSRLSDEATEGVRHLYAMLLARNHQGRDHLVHDVRERHNFLNESFDSRFPEHDAAQREKIVGLVMREYYSVPNHLNLEPETISRLNIINLANELLTAMPKNVCVMRSSAQDFTTSDAPCAYFDPSFPPPEHENTSGPPSLSSPTLELTLPLDRRHVAFISNHPTGRRAQCNTDAVRIVNARTAFFARRMVISYPHDDEEQLAIFVAEVLSEQNAFNVPLLAAFD